MCPHRCLSGSARSLLPSVSVEKGAAVMKPALVIPSYWAGDVASAHAPGAYDHATPLDSEQPELDRCLASLEKVDNLPRVFVLVVCPVAATDRVVERVRAIVDAHPKLEVTLVTNNEAPRITERVSAIAPKIPGECVSLRGYGAIRNMGLAVASIFGHDAVVFLDDDEVVLSSDFMARALYGLGAETRQRLPIIAKTGFFYDSEGSPLADETRRGIIYRWWSKRREFNTWMRGALAGTRISRSNSVCGGLLALHARAYMRVAFDPFITRGEDLDYLFNMRMFGYDIWFDNTWAVKHLPPAIPERSLRFMQDVYRWYYERAKLLHASRLQELNQVTPASLMPYPGSWLTDELDERVARTACVRFLFTREHAGYWHIWRHGRAQAERYARENEAHYLRFQSFWPSIMDGLWNDAGLRATLEQQ